MNSAVEGVVVHMAVERTPGVAAVEYSTILSFEKKLNVSEIKFNPPSLPRNYLSK